MMRNAQLAAGTRSLAREVRWGASGTASQEKMAANSRPQATPNSSAGRQPKAKVTAMPVARFAVMAQA
jgi:hypothetical protein